MTEMDLLDTSAKTCSRSVAILVSGVQVVGGEVGKSRLLSAVEGGSTSLAVKHALN